LYGVIKKTLLLTALCPQPPFYFFLKKDKIDNIIWIQKEKASPQKMHKREKITSENEDESISKVHSHHRHHHTNREKHGNEKDKNGYHNDDDSKELEPIPGECHKDKHVSRKRRLSDTNGVQIPFSGEEKDIPNPKSEDGPPSKKKVGDKKKEEVAANTLETSKRVAWEERATGFLFRGSLDSKTPKESPDAAQHPQTEKREKSLQTIVFLVDVVANGLSLYARRLSFLCKVARVFPLAYKKIGNVLLADAEHHENELETCRRNYRTKHPKDAIRRELFSGPVIASKLQEMCFLKKSVSAARGVSLTLHTEPTSGDIQNACSDGDIQTLKWLVSVLSCKKNGKFVCSHWNRASIYNELCKSGNEKTIKWATKEFKVLEVSKARAIFNSALHYTVDTFLGLIYTIGFHEFPSHLANKICLQAIENITAVEYSESSIRSKKDIVNDDPLVFEKKKAMVSAIVDFINEDILGYQEYLTMLKQVLDMGMAEAIEPSFLLMQRYARKDARVLDIAAKSRHVSSVKWVLSKRGLGWGGDSESLSKIEKQEMNHARRRVVYGACACRRKRGIEVARYLTKRGFGANASTFKLSKLLEYVIRDDEEDRYVANAIVQLFSPSRVVIEKVAEIVLAPKNGKAMPTWKEWLDCRLREVSQRDRTNTATTTTTTTTTASDSPSHIHMTPQKKIHNARTTIDSGEKSIAQPDFGDTSDSENDESE
jgi:hypothetical protein